MNEPMPVPVLIREVQRDRVLVAPAAAGAIAKSADMTRTIEVLLPTDPLHQGPVPAGPES